MAGLRGLSHFHYPGNTLHTPGTDDKRGILQGVGVACPTTESQKDCNDVMRKDLAQWLVDHGISGPKGERWMALVWFRT